MKFSLSISLVALLSTFNHFQPLPRLIKKPGRSFDCAWLQREFLTARFLVELSDGETVNKNNHQSANCECISLWAEFLIRHSELIAKKGWRKETKRFTKFPHFLHHYKFVFVRDLNQKLIEKWKIKVWNSWDLQFLRICYDLRLSNNSYIHLVILSNLPSYLFHFWHHDS